MTYTYTPYSWLYIATIIMNLVMILYLYKNRRQSGTVAFIITLFFSSLWCLETAMESSATNLEAKLLWTRIGYFAYALSPVSWLIMVLQLTDRQRWVNKKRILLLSIIPIITIIFVWTNDLHGLIYGYVYIKANGVFSTLGVKHGPWFWVHAAYSDGMNIFSVILILRFWRQKAPLYGRQFRYLFFSMIFVMIVNVLHILGIGPSFDPTSIAWGISSLFITWALFRNKLFDLVPIASSRVMESMSDAIVVLDLENRIVDMNPSAMSLFNCDAAKSIGCGSADFFKAWHALDKLITKGVDYTEFEYQVCEEKKYYEASCLPVKNERDNLLGKSLIVRDVTEKKMTAARLVQKQREIAVKEEREHMARDLHDNLGQILGFVNVQAQAVMEYLKRDQAQTALKCLERLTKVTQDAQNTVRQAILVMHGETDNENNKISDLFMELDRRIDLFKQGNNIAVEIDCNGVDESIQFGAKVNMQILNIIKESFNNIIKHSHARAVKITFEQNSDKLAISIIDDGCGFDVESTASDSMNKYGLSFMKERAAEIGGFLNLHSEIGKGTTVKILVPCTSPR